MRTLRPLLLLLPAVAIAACSAGGSSSSSSSPVSDTLSADESALSATLGASDAAYGPMMGGGPAAGPCGMGGPGCMPDVTVLETADVCGHQVPSKVQIDWNCTAPDGHAGVTGSDLVETTLTPDTCPATQVAIEQQITIDETRTFDDKSDHVTGTSTASWTQAPPPPPPTSTPAPGSTPPPPPPPADRSMTLDLHVVSTQGSTTVHDAQITGSRDVAFDDAGTQDDPSDDSVVLNGENHVQDAAQDVKADSSDTDVTRVRDCCWPISGTSTLSLGLLSDPTAPVETHTLTFGPSCGDATRDGQAITFPSCPAGPGMGGGGMGGGPGGMGPGGMGH